MTKLLKAGKYKVGWVICRVRRRIPLVRCFRCLGYGHHSRDCKGIDRSNTCYWGEDTNTRGKAVIDMAARLGLIVLKGRVQLKKKKFSLEIKYKL